MKGLKELPFMVFSDEYGNIYDHPYYRMAGFSSRNPYPIAPADLMPMPEFSKLFYLPECAPIGIDPETGEYVVVPDVEMGGEKKNICSCCIS